VSKKTTEQYLLMPGESGWELWANNGDGEKGQVRQFETGLSKAGEIPSLPNGDLTMLFPVRSVTATPLQVSSDDEALFEDLAAMHVERLGLRTDPMAGQLTDFFVISKSAETTSLLPVMLRVPAEGDLPARGPRAFDLSARAMPVTGDVVALWKEFGRWVFAIYQNGVLAYCQATADDSASPGVLLSREIGFALIQLSMQGLNLQPARLLVFSPDQELDVSGLREPLRLPIELRAKPAPVLPAQLSKLLPADVRAARREATRRRNMTIGVAAVATAYLGLIGWLGYGMWKDSAETKRLLAAAKAAAPEGETYALYVAKWDELSHAIELQHNPVDILNRIASCIPPNSGLRLRSADISALSVKLIGEAPQLQAVNTFSLKLGNHNELATFEWQTPEPNQSTRGWEFVFSGEVPSGDIQP